MSSSYCEGDILRFGHEIDTFFDQKKLEDYDKFRKGNCLIFHIKDGEMVFYFYYQTNLFRYDTFSDEINIIYDHPIPIFVNGYISDFNINVFLSQEQKFLVKNVLFYYIDYNIIFYRIPEYDDLEDMKREKFISFLKEIIYNYFNQIRMTYFVFDENDRRVIKSKINDEDNEFWGEMPYFIIYELPKEREEILENPLSITDL